MTSKGHKKHAKTVKPDGGKIHRCEVGFIGAPCGVIQKLAGNINDSLTGLSLGYIDADHGDGKNLPDFHRRYTDKIGFHELRFLSSTIDYEIRGLMGDTDLVLVNGNHFNAEKQIVLINEKKKESLQRKLDRLTDVQFFVLDESVAEPFYYLYAHHPEWRDLPVFKIDDMDKIANAIKQIWAGSIPDIKGLVLAGGKSRRMGTDKSAIDYHGKPQAIYLAELIDQQCEQTYLSKASKSAAMEGFEIIGDSFLNLGPYGGILSAFQSDPNTAWLTVATDVPLLDQQTLELLIKERDPSKFATCFHNPETNFPEPLITIWEPKMYPRLLHFMAMGYSCPRKALINSDIKEIHLDNPEVLVNANTPEEKDAIMVKIG